MHDANAPITLSRRRLLSSLAGLGLWTLSPGAWAARYTEIDWESLIPPDWDPSGDFKDMENLFDLPDSDPRVEALYNRLRKVWDDAPTVPTFDGRAVKIPGFVVPLESGPKGIREFLLVPYFGACIHTPPPPANQIIHVRSATPVRGIQTMSTVWVSGTLTRKRSDSDMGVSAYQVQADRVEAYKE